jgi:ElaB/YqjD/DUF883 family membrane-anchored ribosome-binding protein
MAEQDNGNGRVSAMKEQLAQITKTLDEVRETTARTEQKLTIIATEHVSVMRELWAEPDHVSRMQRVEACVTRLMDCANEQISRKWALGLVVITSAVGLLSGLALNLMLRHLFPR